jgi:mycothiol synthase
METDMAALTLAPGYTIRPARQDDVDAIHNLTAACDLADFGTAEGYSVEELRDEWAALDMDRATWVVEAPSGEIVGYAYIRDRRHVRLDVEGYVHPDHFGKGIGTGLVRASEDRAREHLPLAPEGARVMLHNWINGRNAAACALLEREGYAPARYFLRMETELGEVEPPSWPEGIAVRAFARGTDERRFFDASEEAMADHWGHVPIPFEEWTQRRMGETFDPALWFVADEDGEPAGVMLGSVSEGIGWVDTLAVRRPWRQRGLGMALLRHAMEVFRERELTRMALGVDAASPTGATRLYERAGMHVAQQHATYGKELRPGTELMEVEED